VGDGAVVLLEPHRTQGDHRRDFLQPYRRVPAVDGLQQVESVRSDLNDHLLALVIPLRHTIRVHPGAVTGHPASIDAGGQPVRNSRGQRFQGRTQGLAEKLQPVGRTHRGEHLRGVRALPTPGLEQSLFPAPGQQHVQHFFFQSVVDQPLPESGQHGVVEPCIG